MKLGKFSFKLVCLFSIFVLLSVNSFAEVTLRVYDWSGDNDDKAKVYFDGESLKPPTEASLEGTTWNLGELSGGAHSLRIVNFSSKGVGSYGWEISGGQLTVHDDSANVKPGATVQLEVLSNDVLVAASGGEEITLENKDDEYTTQINLQDSSDQLIVDDIKEAPSEGTASISDDGNSIKYEFDGDGSEDSFKYKVKSPGGLTGTAIVTITPSAESIAPEAKNDFYQVTGSSSTILEVLENDQYSCLKCSTLEVVTQPEAGTAKVTDKKILFEPNYGFVGTDKFTYSISCPCGKSTAEVELTVEHENSPPEAEADGPYEGKVGQTVTLDASGSSDPDTQDQVQYRWDLNDDGFYDTEWLDEPYYGKSWDQPYQGEVVLQVRDLFRGVPTGTTSTAKATVNLVDNAPPSIQVPADITIECDQSRAPEEIGRATATDDSDPNPTVTYSDTSEGQCPEVLTRIWRATDAHGNSSTGEQIIRVVDTTAPELMTPQDTDVECSKSTKPKNTGKARAMDNCDPESKISYTDESSGNCPTLISRRWTAIDSCGNSSSQTQLIRVVDRRSPVAENDTYTVTDASPSTLDVIKNDEDACSPPLSLVSVGSPRYGSIDLKDNRVLFEPAYGHLGQQSFTYTVEDRCGNVSTAQVQLTVEHENSPPEAEADGPYEAKVGQTVTLDASGSSDPDPEDQLQYRWDLNDDGFYDTEWLDESEYELAWDEPYQGQVGLQVRDLFRGAPAGGTSRNEAEVYVIDQPVPLLQISLGGPERVKPGEEFTYSVEVTNRGELGAGQVSLELQLPDIFEVLEANPEPTASDPHSWSLGELDTDESKVVVLTLQPGLPSPAQRGGAFTLKATADHMTQGALELPSIVQNTQVQLKKQTLIEVGVFRDENGDGKRNEGEAGLSGIPVALSDVEVSRTDKKGQVLFRGIEPGNYPISIPEKGISKLNELNLVVSKAKQEVKLEGKEILTVLFPASNKWGQVNGLVFDDSNENGKRDEGEKGIANLQLTLDGQKKTSTDSSGQFQFKEIPPGDHTLLVKAESGQTRTVNFSLQTGDSASLEIPWVRKSGGFLNVEIGNEGGE